MSPGPLVAVVFHRVLAWVLLCIVFFGDYYVQLILLGIFFKYIYIYITRYKFGGYCILKAKLIYFN